MALEVAGVCVPYCAEHGAVSDGLLIESGSLSAKAVWVMLTGRHEGFLQQTENANTEGDVFPPWEVFPQYDSYSGFWKQGGQFWMTGCLLHFGNS
jgi:hypothetical protein